MGFRKQKTVIENQEQNRLLQDREQDQLSIYQQEQKSIKTVRLRKECF